jgi:hypothetical protein
MHKTMAITRANTAVPLPRWVIVVGSAVIVFHLLAVGVFVLAAPSGPWPTPNGTDMALAPFFLEEINNATTRYLDALHLANNYHFQSNHTDLSAVYFEAKLRDQRGKEFLTLKFPQDKANFWVRHRQGLLAQGLGDDRPPEGARPGTNPIAAPGERLQDVFIWKRIGKEAGNEIFILEKKGGQAITPDPDLVGPSPRALLLAKAYARHLGRLHQAASVELIRHSRNQILPDFVFANRQMQLQGVDRRVPYNLNDMIASFGEEKIRDEK